MTDHELLLAMSNMLDTKLNAQLQPIKEDIQEMKGEIRVLKEDVQVIKDEIRVLKEDVQVMKGEIRVLKEDVQVMKIANNDAVFHAKTGCGAYE